MLSYLKLNTEIHVLAVVLFIAAVTIAGDLKSPFLFGLMENASNSDQISSASYYGVK